MENARWALKRDKMSPTEKMKYKSQLQLLPKMTPLLDFKQNADLLLQKIAPLKYTSGLNAVDSPCYTDILTMMESVSKKEYWAIQSTL